MACQRPSSPPSPVDASHRPPSVVDVAVAPASADERPAQRVASVSPEITELLFAMGLGDRVVGVSGLEDFPPEAAQKPRVGPMVSPDVGAVLAQRADAVFTLDGPFSGAAAARLRSESVAIRALRMENLAETLVAIDTLGRWTGRPDAAAALRARMQSDLDAANRAHGSPPGPRVLGLVSRQPLVVVEGPGSWFDDVVRAAGGTVPVTGTNRHPMATPEQITQWAPEVIVDFTGSSEADLRAMFERPDAVPALRARRVIAQTDRLLLRQGARFGEAVRRLRQALTAR